MLNKYLNSDPLPWLIEDSNPAVKYLTKKYILKNADSNDYSDLEKYPPVAKLLEKSKNGILGNIKQFDAYYTGSIWLFSLAVSLGLDFRHGKLKKTAESIIEASGLSSGGFSASALPKTADACLTGLMAKCLISASGDNKYADSSIRWIEDNQRHDGGWLHTPFISSCDILKKIMLNKSGRGLKHETDTGVQSCIFATSSCMNALILSGIRSNIHISRASEFLLKKRLFADDQKNSTPVKMRKALNPDFTLLSVPFFCQYDILDGLNLMALSGNFADIRTSEAFNLIINKQNQEGKWKIESFAPGMLITPETEKNQPNKFVTMRMLILLKNIESSQ